MSAASHTVFIYNKVKLQETDEKDFLQKGIGKANNPCVKNGHSHKPQSQWAHLH